MATTGTQAWQDTEEEEEEVEEEEEEEEEDDRKRRALSSGRSGGGGGGRLTVPRCQADGCNADLSNARPYHRRHKVCEFHAKAAVVPLAGLEQRFCQQCSRFHVVSEFDETKRSCRMRLAGHNERRRKSLTDGQSSTY